VSRFRAQGADCGGIAVWNLVAATRKRKREEKQQDGTSNKSCRAVLCCVHLLPAGFGIWLGQTQAQKKKLLERKEKTDRVVGRQEPSQGHAFFHSLPSGFGAFCAVSSRKTCRTCCLYFSSHTIVSKLDRLV
jgi:hypothetical protein